MIVEFFHDRFAGGTGIVNWIVVSPCEKEPCGFKRNSKIYVDLEAAFGE